MRKKGGREKKQGEIGKMKEGEEKYEPQKEIQRYQMVQN